MKNFFIFLLIVFSFVQCKNYESQMLPSGSHAGYNYEDLGLSVKWATYNVGATKPLEYGDYFAWGEVATKEYYDWSTYRYIDYSDTSLIKYCNYSTYGKDSLVDSILILKLEDDVASMKWNGHWRIPTREEWEELRNNCTWEWIVLDEVNGYLVTSNVLGYTNRSIFLPATGFMWEDSSPYLGSLGCYWSSSLDTIQPYFAINLLFNSDDVNWGDYEFSREFGHSVRAVFP